MGAISNHADIRRIQTLTLENVRDEGAFVRALATQFRAVNLLKEKTQINVFQDSKNSSTAFRAIPAVGE
jgi:hypothetical protein